MLKSEIREILSGRAGVVEKVFKQLLYSLTIVKRAEICFQDIKKRTNYPGVVYNTSNRKTMIKTLPENSTLKPKCQSLKSKRVLINSNVSTVKKQFTVSKEDFHAKHGWLIENMRNSSSISRIHTNAVISSAGLTYIEDTDRVRCDQCKIEISNLTSDMNPFGEHARQSPTCLLVHKVTSKQQQHEIVE
ncbi:unnamed protein product, partial [Didymodactylos carnosus]